MWASISSSDSCSIIWSTTAATSCGVRSPDVVARRASNAVGRDEPLYGDFEDVARKGDLEAGKISLQPRLDHLNVARIECPPRSRKESSFTPTRSRPRTSTQMPARIVSSTSSFGRERRGTRDVRAGRHPGSGSALAVDLAVRRQSGNANRAGRMIAGTMYFGQALRGEVRASRSGVIELPRELAPGVRRCWRMCGGLERGVHRVPTSRKRIREVAERRRGGRHASKRPSPCSSEASAGHLRRIPQRRRPARHNVPRDRAPVPSSRSS